VYDQAPAMRVLVLHNHYQQSGGEDVAVRQEVALLRDRGHEVILLERDNAEIRTDSVLSKAALFSRTVWSRLSFNAVRQLMRESRPDVVHVHNVLPLLSPSVLHAAWSQHVPVVQTLHNYRLICPGTLLRRDGRNCFDCVGRSTWRGLLHACYRDSRMASGGVVAMLEVHRALGTWRSVDAYIALSEFQRQMLLRGGLPSHRLHVKPNFVTWNFPVRDGPGNYALYVGRLSPEKGVHTLVEAWSRLSRLRGLPLRIVGAGPLEAQLHQRIGATGAQVEMLGFRQPHEIAQLLMDARYLVYPSELHEPGGLSAIEAFAAGVPVVASRMGALTELVQHQETGLHFTAGDAADLVATIQQIDRETSVRMGRAARAEYLARFTPERNYDLLMNIYQPLLRSRSPWRS
jgi:glycosyltransferase involved in cell wall biosynthesis